MKTLEVLEKLVSFPSISSSSNLDIINFCKTELSRHGFDCRLQYDASGKKANLFASIGPTSGDGVILSGHTDVVPVEGQAWATDPFVLTRRGDCVFGRGTTDMKGFLASVLALAPEAARLPLKRPLHLAFSHDEEIGCIGVRNLLEDLKSRNFKAALAIIGEPTNMEPVVGHKGKLAGRAYGRGVAGHSAEAPRFLNAIHLVCAVVDAARDVQAELETNGCRDSGYAIPYSTVHAGIITGGEAVNVVPEHASVDFEIRHLPDDNPEAILHDLKRRVTSKIAPLTSNFPDRGVTFETINQYPGLETNGRPQELELVRDLLPNLGDSKVSFGTEAGLFAGKLDLPALVLGPGSMEQGHKPNEFISIAQLEACGGFLQHLLSRMR